MKATFIYILTIVSLVSMMNKAHTQQIWYVKGDAVGGDDGMSWSNAFAHLQDAINTANPGDEIWVAAGTYTPSASDRAISFVLNNQVKLYGGFQGTESNRSQRDWEANPTILSGDLYNNDSTHVSSAEATRSDNSFHVVYAASIVDETAILDGFIIRGGNANAAWPNSNGAGLYCEGGFSGQSSPTIQNCVFEENSAAFLGGAIFSYGAFGGDSSPSIMGCTFRNNVADISGGAIYNYGFSGKSNPVLNQCIFESNRTNDSGGALYNYGDSGESHPTLNECVFLSNQSLVGGAIVNDGSAGSSNPILNACSFTNNTAINFGGAVYNDGEMAGETNPTFIQCDFSGNNASIGGAIYNDGLNGNSHPTFNECTFEANQASLHAGAVYNNGAFGNANPVFINTTFIANYAGFNAGAIYSNGSSSGICNPQIRGCSFIGNYANVYGGALYNSGASGLSIPQLINCSLVGNRADADANGVGEGGAIRNEYSIPNITNSIIWANTSNGNPNQLSEVGNNSSIEYSIIEGGYAGSYNIDTDPLFVDANGEDNIFGTQDDDIRLRLSSPAINSGKIDTTGLSLPLTDVAGRDRMVKMRIDLGAYERSLPDTLSGSGLSMNGGGYVDLGNNLDQAFESITIEAWVKPNTHTSMPLLIRGNSTDIGHIQLDVNNWFRGIAADGTVAFEAQYGQTPQNRIEANEWTHLVAVYNQANASVAIFINGNNVALDYLSVTSGGIGSSSLNTRIGASLDGSISFNGAMDEIRIWHNARSLEDIRLHRHRTLEGTEADLTAYWQFNSSADAVLEPVKEYEASLSSGASFIPSNVPVASGSSSIQTISTAATYDFSLANVFTSFSTVSETGFELVATRLNSPPGGLPATADETYIANSYWIFNTYGDPSYGNVSVEYEAGIQNLNLADIDQPDNLKLFKRPENSEGSWLMYSQATAIDSLTGKVRFEGLTNLSQMAIVSRESTFPIELLHFEANLNDLNQVELRWRTAMEVGNAMFTIERSLDGIFFETIKGIPGAGYSSSPRDYMALDEAPYPNVTYYRLKQTDYDGQFAYSHIVNVYFDAAEPKMAIYPSPTTQDQIYFNILAFDGSVDVTLLDIQGREMSHSQVKVKSGGRYKVNAPMDLLPGIYFLRLEFADKILSERFVIK